MRTTINVDDDVFRAYKLRAAHNGTTLAREIEEALRADLHGLDSQSEAEPFTFPVVRGEALGGIDYTSNADLADLLEDADPDRRR